MQRTISISIDTYAAIWANRHPGEQNEDQILARILGVSPDKAAGAAPASSDNAIGAWEARYDVTFPPGFQVFRTYLGKDYRARAAGGLWVRADNSKGYPSLNELSRSIGAKTENAWVNWYFSAEDGSRRLVDTLRDQTKIRRRGSLVATRTADELGL